MLKQTALFLLQTKNFWVKSGQKNVHLAQFRSISEVFQGRNLGFKFRWKSSISIHFIQFVSSISRTRKMGRDNLPVKDNYKKNTCYFMKCRHELFFRKRFSCLLFLMFWTSLNFSFVISFFKFWFLELSLRREHSVHNAPRPWFCRHFLPCNGESINLYCNNCSRTKSHNSSRFDNSIH